MPVFNVAVLEEALVWMRREIEAESTEEALARVKHDARHGQTSHDKVYEIG